MQKKFSPERPITGTSGAFAAVVTASTSGRTQRPSSFQTDPTDGSVSSWTGSSPRCTRAAVPKTEVTAQVSAKKFVRANRRRPHSSNKLSIVCFLKGKTRASDTLSSEGKQTHTKAPSSSPQLLALPETFKLIFSEIFFHQKTAASFSRNCNELVPPSDRERRVSRFSRRRERCALSSATGC
jgi:hypothetical protein